MMLIYNQKYLRHVEFKKVGVHFEKTGMIRRLDDLGRVVLPKEMRRTLDIAPRSSIEMFVQDGNVHIRK
ncbi:AbrB/MazE/SpoVT family DNA-binding domain-containing protein [Bacillus thuringiensis]|uniref:AbrB/MazE/SpoVT family DNA-binding domain-containing protein n=1 Tax=Bacillus thuringiensis TaxID=1428 RepID=UPI0020D280A3|nr:AbrB/MazE/SpoVT family DNA-binding domain-containing protein [Bacillus thuringiensis]